MYVPALMYGAKSGVPLEVTNSRGGGLVEPIAGLNAFDARLYEFPSGVDMYVVIKGPGAPVAPR